MTQRAKESEMDLCSGPRQKDSTNGKFPEGDADPR